MADYGVTPTGFNRKPLITILGEIQDKVKETFGEGAIQTPESPFGQINGMFASLASTLWEIGEATYQSYDPDQAEGVRLEQLGRIRLLERMGGEVDDDLRAAITNAGRARIDLADIARSVGGIDGVSYVRIFENKSSATDVDGIPPHSLAVAVIGGEDLAIANAIRPFVAPGVNTYGNARVDTAVDGYCRTLTFVRPVPVSLGLQLTVISQPDRLGCPAASNGAIALTVAAALTGANRPANGQDITLHLVRTAVSSVYPNVEVVSATANVLPDGPLKPLPVPIRFFSIASIDPGRVSVTSA
jgi:hypothetical protein